MTTRWIAPLALVAILSGAVCGPGHASPRITTVAGAGARGFGGDGGPATAALMKQPRDVFLLPDGGYLIADPYNNRIRKVSAAGEMFTIAGAGTFGSSGDGGPATAARLQTPEDAVQMPDGAVLIAEWSGNRIRRIAPDGIISTIAGTGVPGGGGDGGPALLAQLDSPRDIAPLPDGGFLIADEGAAGAGGNRIRRVAPDGTISTVAGTGTAGFGGDGGPATAAQMNGPRAVAVLPDGGFLVADTSNNRIRRVSGAGTITTVAGTGVGGFRGDGGRAWLAELHTPRGVAAIPGGGYLIADTDNNRIRRVSPAGVITTVAGVLTAGFSGDGGPAVAATLDHPRAAVPSADGGILIADSENNRVRHVEPSTARVLSLRLLVRGPVRHARRHVIVIQADEPAGGVRVAVQERRAKWRTLRVLELRGHRTPVALRLDQRPRHVFRLVCLHSGRVSATRRVVVKVGPASHGV